MKTIYFDLDLPRVAATKAASKTFHSLLFTGLNAVKYAKHLPDPPLPAPDWVRVRNIQCGVCGTDLSFFRCTATTNCALAPIPGSRRTYLGHENVGVVTEVGPAVTKFQVGDRVTLQEYMSSCGNKSIPQPCRFCKEGNYCLCENYGEPSPLKLPDVGAGFGDQFIAPQKQLTKIFDELTDDQATLVEPTAVSLHAVLRHTPQKGERVMVLGCGTIGLGVVQALKIFQPDCEVWVMERIKAKQAFAKKLGADHILFGDPYAATAKATGGSKVYGGKKNKMFFGGFDVIYDCVGGGWANTTCLRLLRARGTLVKIGHHMSAITFDETPIWWQELTLVGVDAHGMEHIDGRDISTFDLAQELIRDGKYRTEGFITHRFPLDDYKKAFRLMMENPPELVKVVLDCRK